MNTHRASVLTSTLLLALAVAACNNPAQPSTTTASVVAPRALQPASGAQIRNVDQPVTLVVANALVTRPGGTTYTFEVAADAAFGSKVQTRDGVAEGSAGQTSVTLGSLAPATDYFWHARASGGGTTGVFGTTYKFTVGPAVTLDPPTPIGPLSGAQVTSRPPFRATNAIKQGPAGPITYKFEIARDSGFTSLVVTATVAEGSRETDYVPTSDLPIGVTLYWRVTAIDASNSVTSSPSAVQNFTTRLPTQAEQIALKLGAVLWPGAVPSGVNGQAVLGDSCDGSPNWGIATCYSPVAGVTFQAPTIEALRYFDLFDRGYDPQSAINWMHSNGYPTAAQWYPPPEKAVLGLGYFYLAARGKVVGPGTIWDIVIGLG